MPQLRDIVWLAGLLEGEGSFIWNRAWVSWKKSGERRAYYRPKISIGMSDKDIIDRVAKLWGRSVTPYKDKNPTHKIMYHTECQGVKAMSWMMMLYPLLGQRRQTRIQEIISLWKAVL